MASDSDSSGLSEADEKEIQKLAPIFIKAKKATKKAAPPPPSPPPKRTRAPSPPHEEVLADNPDIAFLVMFRSRFHAAFPSKLQHFGPQDIERGVVDDAISAQIESLLRALLGLVLNRKKPVEQGHYGRAMEEAIASHKTQWPRAWGGVNPLRGDRDFNSLLPTERLQMLRTLVMWALSSSEEIQATIKESYKQSRHHDDENQPLSVQPWGRDGAKRRYFLIEGQEDTCFRVYREGKMYARKGSATWWSVAGGIEEVRALAQRLDSKEYDGSQPARTLSQRMLNAIPRFEATEEKHRRREHRQMRKAAFTRSEPGLSLYEGRTRGKRPRYTYDDDEDGNLDSDATSTRRSARQSTRNTPFETGPTYTASGRQVRPRQGGEYGASALSATFNSTDELARIDGGRVGSEEDEDDVVKGGGRVMRSAGRAAVTGASNPRKRKHIDGYNDIDDMSEEEDAAVSVDGWDSDANEGEGEDEPVPDAGDEKVDEASEDEDEEEEEEDEERKSLLVKIRLPGKAPSNKPAVGVESEHNQLNGRAVLKRERGDGSLHPAARYATGEYTHAGAAESEGQQVNGLTSGNTAKSHTPASQHQLQSATTPSAYPTPYSVVEQKSAMAT